MYALALYLTLRPCSGPTAAPHNTQAGNSPVPHSSLLCRGFDHSLTIAILSMEKEDASSGPAWKTRDTSTSPVFRLGSGAARSTPRALCALAFIITTTMYLFGNCKPEDVKTTDEGKQCAVHFVNTQALRGTSTFNHMQPTTSRNAYVISRQLNSEVSRDKVHQKITMTHQKTTMTPPTILEQLSIRYFKATQFMCSLLFSGLLISMCQGGRHRGGHAEDAPVWEPGGPSHFNDGYNTSKHG